jgi:hypothetical protein
MNSGTHHDFCSIFCLLIPPLQPRLHCAGHRCRAGHCRAGGARRVCCTGAPGGGCCAAPRAAGRRDGRHGPRACGGARRRVRVGRRRPRGGCPAPLIRRRGRAEIGNPFDNEFSRFFTLKKNCAPQNVVVLFFVLFCLGIFYVLPFLPPADGFSR